MNSKRRRSRVKMKMSQIKSLRLLKKKVERGREKQVNKKDQRNMKRGQSELCKTFLKPAGAIFGIDKSLPTNEIMGKESHTEDNNVKDNKVLN